MSKVTKSGLGGNATLLSRTKCYQGELRGPKVLASNYRARRFKMLPSLPRMADSTAIIAPVGINPLRMPRAGWQLILLPIVMDLFRHLGHTHLFDHGRGRHVFVLHQRSRLRTRGNAASVVVIDRDKLFLFELLRDLFLRF